MKTNEIQTNLTTFMLNECRLEQDYDLTMATITSATPKAVFPTFERAVKNSTALALTRLAKNRYIILFKQGEMESLRSCQNVHYTPIDFSAISNKQSPLYANHVVQLLLNQLSVDPLVPAINLTPRLIISREKWRKSLSTGRQQRYGLKVGLNWERDLVLSVVTFIEVPSNDSTFEKYVWDAGRELMVRTYNADDADTPVFKQGNTTNSRNQVDFMRIDQLENFEQSKVGIAERLLTNLNTQFADYFLQAIDFKAFPLQENSVPKLPKPVSENLTGILRFFKNQTLTLYAESKEPLTIELAQRLFEGFKNSPQLAQLGIKVVLRPSAASGFNLHVIHDSRKDPTHLETYQVGSANQVIQHLTVEGFGCFNPYTKQLEWQASATRDIMTRPEIVNIFQELMIKQDVRQRQIQLVPSELLMLTSQFQFYWFVWHDTHPVTITVIRGSVSVTGKLNFITDTIALEQWDATSELNQVCRLVWVELRRATAKYIWEQIDGVIQQGSIYILIQQTPRQLFPNSHELRQRQEHVDENRRLKKLKILTDLNRLKELKTTVSTNKALISQQTAYLDALATITQAIRMIPGPFLTIRTIQKAIKASSINYLQRAPQDVCFDLERHFGYTFHNSSRQKRPTSLLNGFRGMGLIQIETKYFYYVGTHQPLRDRFIRAYRLRKLVPLTGDTQAVPQIFTKLMQLMNVEFVRNGQYTVVPYMNKYLREFWTDTHHRMLKQNQSEKSGVGKIASSDDS